MNELWDRLATRGADRCFLFSDAETGLRAALVIDDLTLGPAAGGIRTRPYPSMASAIGDAASLARAMTIKCALSGLAAGGGKVVVLDHDGLDRPRAFERLGQHVEELGGMFRTAGDLGTTADDLKAVARTTGYVHTDEKGLAGAVARGLASCAEACAIARRGRSHSPLSELRVAVQGCGAIGSAVARELAARGAAVLVSDLDSRRAELVGRSIGAQVVPPEEILTRDVHILAPCAVGGILSAQAAHQVTAWAICGAANNILQSPDVDRILLQRGILHVPDVIASAGAVVDGIGRTVMGLSDRGPLIDGLGETAAEVLKMSRETGRPSGAVAESLARERIERAKATAPG